MNHDGSGRVHTAYLYFFLTRATALYLRPDSSEEDILFGFFLEPSGTFDLGVSGDATPTLTRT